MERKVGEWIEDLLGTHIFTLFHSTICFYYVLNYLNYLFTLVGEQIADTSDLYRSLKDGIVLTKCALYWFPSVKVSINVLFIKFSGSLIKLNLESFRRLTDQRRPANHCMFSWSAYVAVSLVPPYQIKGIISSLLGEYKSIFGSMLEDRHPQYRDLRYL